MKETLEKLDLDEGIESAQIDTGDQVIKIEVEDKDAVVEPLDDLSQLPIEGDDIDEFELADKEEEDETEEADDDGSQELVDSLQKALRKNHNLTRKVEELQTQLSVSRAKEAKLEEEVDRYKQSTERLSQRAKQVRELKESVSQLETKVQAQKRRISDLSERLNNSNTSLEGAVKTKEDEINRLIKKVDKLSESLDNYSDRLKRAKGLVEKYKSAADVASTKYIEVQAKAHGVSVEQVNRQLSESFTLKDVDRICESLASQGLRISKLPFDVSKKIRVTTESKSEPILGESKNLMDDDLVDDSLLRLANL